MFTTDLFEPSKPAIGLEVFNQLMQCVEKNSGCDLSIGIEVKNITAQEARYILGQYRSISKDNKESGLAFLSDVREIERCLECIDDRTQGSEQVHFVNADQYAEPSNYQVRETDKTNMPIGSPRSFATHEEALAYAKECKATNPNHKFAIYRVAFTMDQSGVPAIGEDRLNTEIYSVSIQNTKTGGKRNVEMRVKDGSPEAAALEYLQANETIKSITPKEGVLDSVDEAEETKLDLSKGVIPTEPVAEGWSDAIVAQRTGQPRTPYSVYIKGKKWKDFENDDHAEAVANKLRAKFKAEGRDPSVITIAPTDYDKGMTEAISKKDLLGKLQKDLPKVNNPENKGDPNAWARGDLYTGARDQEDIDQMSRRDTSEPRPTATQRAKDLRMRNKRNGVAEASSPAQQAAIAVNMKKAHKKPASVNEADPGKVDTKTLQSIHALHKTSGERGDTRSAQSAQRIAAELAKRGVKVAEGAIDDLEARRIETLNDKMDEIFARAGELAKSNPEAAKAYMNKFNALKAERDSYYKVRDVNEAQSRANFKTRLDAIAYAKGKVKTHRDPFDGIEIWAIDDGFDVNHTMNANGRNWLKDNGAKHITTVYPNKLDVDSNKVSEGTDWKEYERKVAALEKKGLSRSDAQGVVDAQMMQSKVSEGRDGQYHENNPKIDLFNRDTKKYLGSTNWYTTVRAAVQSMEEKHPELAGKVMGQKSVKEADQKKNNVAPRNFVVKNMKQSGQGQHRDVKKAQKQGDFKHKRDAVPMDETLKDENPCWKGYHPVGTKEKNGKTVPNCVPGRADEAQTNDVNFGTTVGKGSWIVYDPVTKQIKKRFTTHTAGKSYAQTHKLGFASSEHYFDKVKDNVAEGVEDGLASTILRRILAKNRDVLSRHSADAVLDAAREEATMADTDDIDELTQRTINTLDHEMHSHREFAEGDYNAPNTDKTIKSKAWHANYYGGLDEAEKAELKPGQYYIWTAKFDDGTSSRVKVTSDDFNAKDFYAKKGKNVINVDYNWDLHGTEDSSASTGASKKLAQADSEVEADDTLNEISKDTVDNYYSKVAKQQMDKEGLHKDMYSNLPKKRQQGIDRATDRMLKKD